MISHALTAREGKGPDSDAVSGFIVAPTLTAGWGTNHGSPGNGSKDDAALAVIAATLQGGVERGYRVDAESAAGGHLIAAPLTAGSATGDGVNAPGQRREDDINLVVDTLRSHPRPGSNTPGATVAHSLTAEGADASEDGTGRGTPLVAVPVQDCRAIDKAMNGLGVGDEGDVSYTLDTTSAQGVATNSAVRRLTPLECERLQGFPDGWTDGQSDSARYRQLGNAVAVPVVEWISRRIAATEASVSATEAGAA